MTTPPSYKTELYDFMQRRRATGYAYNSVRAYAPTHDDIDALALISDKYGLPFRWLVNLINFESGGTFNPAIKNPTSSASGLIQFMAETAKGLGTTTAALRAMTFQQQLKYVDKYLANVLNKYLKDGKVKTTFSQLDLFMTIFYPAAIGKGAGYQFSEKVRKANPGINTAGDYLTYATKRAIFTNTSSKLADEFTKASGEQNKGGFLTILLLAAASFLLYKYSKT